MLLNDLFKNQPLDSSVKSLHEMSMSKQPDIRRDQTMGLEGLIMDDGDLEEEHAPYPGQSSGRLKNYVRNKYGGEITCRKASAIINDPDVNNFYRKRAIWYKSLHCKGTKQIREEIPQDTGAALTIWDIDDTLFHTTAMVVVKKPDGSKEKLSSSEFNDYKLKPGEEFDFSEFEDAKLFHQTSKPIKNIWKTAQKTLANIGKRPGSKMVIVTARRDLNNKDLFLDTFKKHGMNMNKVHVYRAGNLPVGNSSEKKKVIIRNLLKSGNYTEARLFDDHFDNLKTFLELKEEFPEVTFKAFAVGPSGRVSSPVTL